MITIANRHAVGNCSYGSLARPIGWQDAPLSVSLTQEQASALKWLGLRWQEKPLERIGFRAESQLVGADGGAFCIVTLTPRRILKALAYADAERVTAEADPEYWGGERLDWLDSLIQELSAVRTVLGF